MAGPGVGMNETHEVATAAEPSSGPVAVVEPPRYRPVPAEVVRVTRLSPTFVRVTFGGPGLAGFGYAGADQRIKLLFAPPGGSEEVEIPAADDWYLRWRELPEDRRPVRRTYTVRASRPALHEVDVDFVLHGHGDAAGASGPASRWASRARPGETIGLLGPDRPGTGRLWGVEWCPPPTAREALLAGDEAALPAICAVLEELRPGLRTTVCVELPEAGDVPDLSPPAGVDLRWLVRRTPAGEVARGELLEAAVRELLPGMGTGGAAQFGRAAAPSGQLDPEPDPEALLWDIPEPDGTDAGSPYVWMAGEAAVMTRLRRFARRELGLPRSAVACMGYWRHGSAES